MEAWLTTFGIGLPPEGYEYLAYILGGQFALMTTIVVLDMVGRFLNSVMKGGGIK